MEPYRIEDLSKNRNFVRLKNASLTPHVATSDNPRHLLTYRKEISVERVKNVSGFQQCKIAGYCDLRDSGCEWSQWRIAACSRKATQSRLHWRPRAARSLH